MSTKVRKSPSESLLSFRKRYLAGLQHLSPRKVDSLELITLEPGNKKTGHYGRHYSSILVWNLPAIVTCPSASEWCLSNCYNADNRLDVYPVDKWAENWWAVKNHPNDVSDSIISQLFDADKPCAVRVHSSGDFFSIDYIDLWIKIAKRSSDTHFWAYTRSWGCNDLFPYLEKLRSLENVQIIASWDTTMDSLPPSNWRKCLVCHNETEASLYLHDPSNMVICPEQIGLVDNCASCGLCMRNINKDIIFLFH